MLRLRDARLLPAGWLTFLALFGGASRFDEWQQLVVPIGAMAILAIALWSPDRPLQRARRGLWLLLAATAIAIGIQLIPLPPGLWAGLSGRSAFLPTGTLIGMGEIWRPMSLTPDLTWAALLSLLPVAATLAIAPDARSPALRPLLYAAIGLVLAAILLGMVQSLGAATLSFFRLANTDSAIGFFANRNHHAVFLTLAFPIIAYLVAWARPGSAAPMTPAIVAAAVAGLCLVSIVQASSRSGLVLGAVMLGVVLTTMATGHLSLPTSGGRRSAAVPVSRPSRKVVAAAACGTVAIAALAAIVVQSPAMDRLMQSDVTYDFRAQTLSTLLGMANLYFPFGSGYGSFATIYRMSEPFNMLGFSYLNQAHNDILQVVIEGGAAGAALMIAAASAWAWRGISILRDPRTAERAIGMVGFLMVGALFAASLLDYPLRTPLMAGMLAFAAVFMTRPAGRAPADAEE